MPKDEKAQVFTSDIVIATIIFIIILGLFIHLWAGIVEDIAGMEVEYEVAWLATAGTEKLVRTAGYPQNWTLNPSLSNVTILGLADTETILNSTKVLDRIIDPDKLMYFINFSRENYSTMRGRIFSLGRYEYYAELSCLDDTNMDCFQNMTSRTLDDQRINCTNNAVFHVINHRIWADPYLVASFHFEEGGGVRVIDSSGNELTGKPYGALKVSCIMGASSNSYVYEDLSSVNDYVIQNNDYLEYDLYWTLPDDDIAVDYTTSTGLNLRDSGATDQNYRLAHPATNLTQYALGKWYHRKIALPSSHTGQTIKYFDIACENNIEGPRTAYIDNIIITNGVGIVRKTIYNATAFNHSLHMQKDGVLSSLSNEGPPTAWNSSGKYGGAIYFDGKNDRIEIADDPRLNPTDQLTVSLWFNAGDPSADQWLLSKERPFYSGYAVRLSGSNVWFDVSSHNDSGTYLWGTVNTTNTIIPNTWYYFAGVYSSTNGSAVYLNGVPVKTNPLARMNASNKTLLIGGSEDNPSGIQNFQGLIDEVKIWSRALSAEEIWADYAHGRKICLVGQNASLSEANYMGYDTKTFTFQKADEAGSDPQSTFFKPTAKIKMVIYSPA